MVRFFNAMAGRFFAGAETWLCSLGVALLVVSVLLVPTSRLLADDGGNGPLAINDCKAANGCVTDCAYVQPSGPCNYQYPRKGGCSNGCSLCYCTLCQYSGKPFYCACQCMQGLGSCNPDTDACYPN